jgi:biopolymer transport protein ExbD
MVLVSTGPGVPVRLPMVGVPTTSVVTAMVGTAGVAVWFPPPATQAARKTEPITIKLKARPNFFISSLFSFQFEQNKVLPP